MTLTLGDTFPDIELPDHTGASRLLSSLNQPTLLDSRVGFTTGYPMVVVFYRGFFCPRDYQQLRRLVELQTELQLSFVRVVAISVDEPKVAAAYRAGLGAQWPFLSDQHRQIARQLDIVDNTEGVVESFDLQNGTGTIRAADATAVFFHFTAIPGEGYRTLPAGTKVSFELIDHLGGPTASNVQRL